MRSIAYKICYALLLGFVFNISLGSQMSGEFTLEVTWKFQLPFLKYYVVNKF